MSEVQRLLGRITALEIDLHDIVRNLEDGAVEDALRTAKNALNGGGAADDAPVCARCESDAPIRPGDQSLFGTFCAACIDRCHESTDFAHQCPVCLWPDGEEASDA